jgi:large subunit ribosomal protein L21
MYVIVNVAGEQLKVRENDVLLVNKLPFAVGEQVGFEEVLLCVDDVKMVLGTPTVPGAKVLVKVLGHPKADKVIVFKKRRRKGYAKKQGHRQQYSQVRIEEILIG